MSPSVRVVGGPFVVDHPANVALRIRPGMPLKAADVIEIQFPNSWLLVSGPSFTRPVQTVDPQGPHYLCVHADGASFDLDIRENHLPFPQGRARHGRLLTARLRAGAVRASGVVHCEFRNTMAPYVAEQETVWVRVNGLLPRQLPEIVTAPGPAETVRLIVPSAARPGEPFDVLVVSLDRFENCSSTRYHGRVLELIGHGRVADRLTFTGSTRVPVRIDKPGVWRFGMDGVVSNAVRIGRRARGPFWGDLHGHSKLSSDGMGADPYGYARDVAGLDFAAVTDHAEDLGADGYEQLLRWARAAHRPGRFITVLADERNPDGWTGHHNVYFRDEATFARCRLRPGCFPRNSPEESQESMRALLANTKGCLVVPHHTGMSWRTLPKPGSIGDAVDLDAVRDDRGLRPVMEIYSHHGQSECYAPGHILAYEFNRMRNPESRSNTSVPGPYYAQAYWLAGRRLGVIGSSDEHSGQPGRRHGGLAAIFATSLTRGGLFDALHARHCYATTGERILLEFSVDGVQMGQQERRPTDQKLSIRLKVWATAGLIRVDILRCRFGTDHEFRLIHSESPRAATGTGVNDPRSAGLQTMVLDHAVELDDADPRPGPAAYYARVVQEPVDWPGMAWSSPVWIDPE